MDKRKWFLTALSIPIVFLGIWPVFARTAVYSVPRQAITSSSTKVLANGQILTGMGILAEVDRLIKLYGTRPYWKKAAFKREQKVPAAEAPDVVAHLIPCESLDRDVKIVDSNGFYSYGRLQFQSSTWEQFSEESGITGDPMNANDAIRMALWAVENGYLSHWSCARILGIIHS